MEIMKIDNEMKERLFRELREKNMNFYLICEEVVCEIEKDVIFFISLLMFVFIFGKFFYDLVDG